MFALDQLTKQLALEALGDGPIELIGEVVRLNLTFNRGGAFGLLGNASTFFLIATILVVGVILVVARKVTETSWMLALGAVLGGGLGNAYDRLFRGFDGGVVDFIDVGWWPVFNVADSAIVCGGLVIFVLGWRDTSKTE